MFLLAKNRMPKMVGRMIGFGVIKFALVVLWLLGKLPVLNPRFCLVLAGVFFRDERQRFFLLPMETKCVQGSIDRIKIRFDNL